MESNPTTGYTWIIPQEYKGENDIYQISNSEYFPDKPKNEEEEGMTGRGGTQKVNKFKLIFDFSSPSPLKRKGKRLFS